MINLITQIFFFFRLIHFNIFFQNLCVEFLNEIRNLYQTKLWIYLELGFLLLETIILSFSNICFLIFYTSPLIQFSHIVLTSLHQLFKKWKQVETILMTQHGDINWIYRKIGSKNEYLLMNLNKEILKYLLLQMR